MEEKPFRIIRNRLDQGQLKLLALIAAHHHLRVEEVLDELIRNYNALHLNEFLKSLGSEPLEGSPSFGGGGAGPVSRGRYKVNLDDLARQISKVDIKRLPGMRKKKRLTTDDDENVFSIIDDAK
jgi:hypothetical protein